MKIGLYFGSFNPIHNGHLIIASHFLNETDLDEVWMVVSPQNPFKESGARRGHINTGTRSPRLAANDEEEIAT